MVYEFVYWKYVFTSRIQVMQHILFLSSVGVSNSNNESRLLGFLDRKMTGEL
jgi:hypothetical protein